MKFKSTEETIGWFKDRFAEGTLIIKPPYQRKPVWLLRQKCHLVESVLKDLPIPELFVQRSTDEEGKTTYAVVDGQQRVRALLQFVGVDTTEDQLEFDKFPLDKLEADSDWFGLSFAELEAEGKRDFYGYALAVRYLDTDDEEEMKDMFRRLNRYTAPLKPQELRNATYEGPFARLATKLADEHTDYFAENRIVTAASIRRMGDVELIAELLIGIMHGPQAGSPTSIDSYYQQYEDFDDDFPGQRRTTRLFGTTLDTINQILPDLRDLRWGNKTDFYSLFVALAALLPTKKLPRSKEKSLRAALTKLAGEIDRRLADDDAKVTKGAASYVRNVQRGANDKARRAERHAVLLAAMNSYFS
jgi:hypothetical protein